VFDQLTEYVSGSPWTYLFLVAVVALDVLLPLLPSETSVILAGVLAASGDLALGPVAAAAATGALLGDNTAYAIGRAPGTRLVDRLRRGQRRGTVEWAERQLRERAGYLIVVARFIPAGRTAVTVTAGSLRLRFVRFLAWDLVAAVGWATFATGLGYFGGHAFEQEPWKGFLLAFGIALGITGAVELARRLRRTRLTPP
jgi:membrane-associated protein